MSFLRESLNTDCGAEKRNETCECARYKLLVLRSFCVQSATEQALLLSGSDFHFLHPTRDFPITVTLLLTCKCTSTAET